MAVKSTKVVNVVNLEVVKNILSIFKHTRGTKSCLFVYKNNTIGFTFECETEAAQNRVMKKLMHTTNLSFTGLGRRYVGAGSISFIDDKDETGISARDRLLLWCDQRYITGGESEGYSYNYVFYHGNNLKWNKSI